MSTSIIIDADAHVSIRENLFAERFPASLQSRRPQRLTVDGDKFFWLVEGRMVPKPSGRGPGTPRGFTPRGAPKDHYLDNVPGRLEDMDQEGVAVQVLYPDLVLVDPDIHDRELASAMARAFNDYAAEQCRDSGARLKRVAVIALQDAQMAADELERAVVDLRCSGAVIAPFFGERMLSHSDFQVFFQRANNLKTAIAVHGVTGVYSMPWQDLFFNTFAAHMVAMPVAYMVALTALFDGDMFEKYPQIRFAFLESGCGWAPYWVRRLDEHLQNRKPGHTPASQLVRDGRIFFGCEPGEYHIPHVIAELGEGCLLYSSDYPHGDSKWPHTVSMIREVLGVSETAQRKILGENAARFYGITD
jgi:predicted TIM-barrel fold metal-dependent hydrolase